MELNGKIALIKYIRKIADVGLVEAKEIADAFIGIRFCDSDPIPPLFDQDIVILSLFVGEIKRGGWIIRDGKVWKNSPISYRDVVDLTNF